MHHHHHGDHACHPGADATGRVLLLTMGLNLAIPICQIIGGLMAQSLAVVSDAAHNFSDFMSLLLAYVALRIACRPPSLKFTYGYRRAETLAAMANVALLLGACLFILLESFHRIRNPQPVSGGLVAMLALVGVAGNGLSVALLHRGSQHDLNVRGALLHMVADLAMSVAVLVNGLILLYRPWYWLDPALSVLIVLFILKNCWSVLKEAGRVLMEAAPLDLDLTAIRSRLESLPEVVSAHHLHAWSVGSNSVFLTSHIQVPDQALSLIDPVAQRIRGLLLREFGIDHAVLEFEHCACGDNHTLCCRGEEEP